MHSRWRPLAWLAPFVFWGLALYVLLGGLPARPSELPYSEFKAALAAGRVQNVVVSPSVVRGTITADAEPTRPFVSVRVDDPDLLHDLGAHGVTVAGEVDGSLVRDVLSWVVPALVFVGLFMLVSRRMGAGGAGSSLLAVGRSRAKLYVEQEVKVTFADVAGVDEAKEELREVIEFLKTPERFRRLGGKIPKGILLLGPPGTGKTLLARAVAGEAGVPFFSISGSEFVELFVGVGAARVRDLFEQAKQKAPCIIFIDELDALGKARGVGPMAHEEREQTLNQLLVEMDGFDPRAGVILMAATNRPEILDPALLRAGRFDRHVLVDRPDRVGRLAILRLHARTVVLANLADLDVVAGMTPGFAGADLANVVNEAALLAARRDKAAVELADLQEAVERVIAGLEKKNRVLNAAEKERVAHHEVGHALVAVSLRGTDPVQKISIIPRGVAALGYTIQLPTEDRFLMAQSELESKIAVLLGGRAAEELIYGETSTGAQDDLEKATAIARSMVKAYGMSDRIGLVSLERDRPSHFLPIEPAPARGDYSEETAREIDCEVRRIVDAEHARARALLAEQEDVLREAATLLQQKEIISGEELAAVRARRTSSLRPVARAGA
jgi:cell division protease FtsH